MDAVHMRAGERILDITVLSKRRRRDGDAWRERPVFIGV
jgi:hypothetical protein